MPTERQDQLRIVEAKHIEEFDPSAVLGSEIDQIDVKIRALGKDLMPTLAVQDLAQASEKIEAVRAQVAMLKQERQQLLDLSTAVIKNKNNPEVLQRLSEYFDKKSSESAKNLQELYARDKKEESEDTPAFQKYAKLRKMVRDAQEMNEKAIVNAVKKAMAKTRYGAMLSETEKESTNLQHFQEVAFEFKRRSEDNPV